MPSRKFAKRSLLSLSALVLLISGGALIAGPLDPPAGPVAPTFKTLADVEPRIAINQANTPGDATNTFVISQSGSYYLTANVTGEPGKNGIRVVANNVVVDLNGFTMNGNATSLDGFALPPSGLTVRNGIVRNWTTGLSLRAGSKVIGVQANNNRAGGISTGSQSEVRGCSANANAGAGISVSGNSTVSDSIVEINGGNGISMGSGCVAERCVSTSNTGSGFSALLRCQITACTAFANVISGFIVGEGSSVADCTATGNSQSGLVTGPSCTVSGSTVQLTASSAFPGISLGEYSVLSRSLSTRNSGSGVSLAHGCRVTDSVSSNNSGDGFLLVGTGSTLIGCSAMINRGNGFSFQAATGHGSMFNSCSARENTAHGFNVPFYTSIVDGHASSNALDGIRTGQGCIIRGNTCNGNGTDAATGAGIHCVGSDSRVEGNQCNQNDRGIELDANGNFVVRNSCAGNSFDYDVVAGNVILVINAATSPAFAGSAGGVAPGSADPNANFSY